MDKLLGIDVGGTGIKGGIVDLKTGSMLTDRTKIKTPSPSTPKAVIQIIKELISIKKWEGKPFGMCFPSVIDQGKVKTASNIDKSWIGFNIEKQFKKELGVPVTALNDADSAGIAEMVYGAGKGELGTVIMLTLGTGIGSGIFYNGQLIPNTELGHLSYQNGIWEDYASNRARESKNLNWEEWATELNRYLKHVEFLFSPNLFILGGGVCKKFELYKSFIKLNTRIVPANLLNRAGVIGAAYAAHQRFQR